MKKTFILSLTASALILGSLSSAAFAQSEPTVAPMVDESAPNDTAAPKAENGKKKGHKKAKKAAKAKKHAKKKHAAKKEHAAEAPASN